MNCQIKPTTFYENGSLLGVSEKVYPRVDNFVFVSKPSKKNYRIAWSTASKGITCADALGELDRRMMLLSQVSRQRSALQVSFGTRPGLCFLLRRRRGRGCLGSCQIRSQSGTA
ncbi:hypothetical protein ABW19_dt0207761 [Dactylella cylindrospora]|nr:hypothetical protein ABW19_dt0207761 [Dactylella cylindrospora]